MSPRHAKRALPPASLSAVDERYSRPPAGRRCGPVLSAEEMSWARHAVAETILRRTRTGEPVPQPLHDVLSRLTDLLVIGVPAAGSVDGTGFDSGLGELAEWLDSAEVAAVIGCTREYVRRIAEGLGGRRIGRRWIFPPDAIQEHVQGKEGA